MVESLEQRRLFNVDWRNPVDSLDVDTDGNVSPLDALIVINYINGVGSGSLASSYDPSKPYYDVDGDQSVSPLDVLSVINHLNASGSGTRSLVENAGQFVHESNVAITLGQTAGARKYRVRIDSQFDTTDGTAALEDLLAVYLVDAKHTATTLLDRGVNGTALFTLAGTKAEFIPGRVQWDGSVLEIDMSDVNSTDTGLLKFQLLNSDSDGTTRVTIQPLANLVDVNETSSSRLLTENTPIDAGGALPLSSLTSFSDVRLQVSNVRFDSATGKYRAEIRVQNNGSSLGRDVAVVFPSLPADVTLVNPSGTTTAGAPYVNLKPAIPRGGLTQGSSSQTVVIEFNNPGKVPFAIKPQVLAMTNRAPTMAAIGAQTVMPGGVLRIPLVAQDQDGDRINYSIRTSDAFAAMPTGVIDAAGALTFRPTPSQLGVYQFDVVASDGSLEAVRTVTLNVVADPVTTTRVSGKVLKVNGQPLASMPVQIGSVQGLTASDGSFSLDLGSGTVVSDTLKVRGELISGPVLYPFIAEKIAFVLDHEVYLHVNNVIDRPIYLPEIDVANGKTIDPTRNTTVTSSALPGAKVDVAASTLMNQQGTPFTGVLSMTEVPVELTPAALPEGLNADLVVTIQPGEMVFTTPTPLSLPNRGGFAPGTVMDLWSINPITGQFDKVGIGQVSANGTVIDTINGGIRNSSWHFFSPPAPTGPKTKGDPRNKKPNGCGATADATSSCELHSGALVETHELVTYQSQGVSRGFTLTYDSLRADPRPIVHFTFDELNPNLYSVPSAVRLIAELEVSRNGVTTQVPGFQGGAYGLSGNENIWRLPADSGSADAALQVDLREQPTGVYDYTLRAGMLGYAGARGFIGTLNESTGQFASVNTRRSPLGAGWGIDGLLELVENRDGSVLVVDGNGSEVLYSKNASGSYDLPPGVFGILSKMPNGTFRRVWPDQTVEQYDAHNRLISIGDRNDNLSQYQYDSAGRFTKFIDPVGLETVLTYSASAIEITDPASRVTRLNLDASGNLVRVTDPDGSSRQWRYDSRGHMTGETDQLGNIEIANYGFHGRVTDVVRKDGTARHYSPIDIQGLYPPEQTAADPIATPQLNPIAGRVPLSESTFVDINGNVTRSKLDDRGQIVSASDNLGALSSVVRDVKGLPIQTTDANGNATWFTYDAKGNVLTKSVDLNSKQFTFGSAMRFDGVDDYVQINDTPALRPTDVTLETWASFSSPPSIAILIGKTVGSSTHDSYNIWYQDGELRGFVSDGNQFNVVGMPWKPELGRWYHIAYTFDDTANTQTLYLDGAPVATSAANVSIRYDSHPVLIGREIDDERLQYAFPGMIDEVRIWGVARSEEEIRRDSTRPLNGNEPGLIAYYQFNETSSSEVVDSTSNHLNGSMPANTLEYIASTVPMVKPVASPIGMTSWWSGDGYTNDLFANNNGTIRNGVGFTSGIDGLAFTFDGQNDVVTVPDASDGSLDIVGDLTINAWIKPNVISGDQRTIVQKRPLSGNDSVAYGFFLESDGRLAFTSRQNGGEFRIVYSESIIATNSWSHVAVTLSDEVVHFYIDGVRDSTRQYPFIRPVTNGPMTIGATVVDGSTAHPFNGGIDELQLFHRALTVDEVSKIYRADRAGQSKPTVYDSTRDFSLQLDPSNVWAYGYSTAQNPEFHRSSLRNDDGKILYWNETVNGPFVFRPRNRQSQNYFGLPSDPPADVLNLDPSIDGRNSVVQWTAPVAGTYRINGRFEAIDHSTTDVSILLNSSVNSPLITGSINGLRSQVPFSITRTLSAGDRIQFTVNPRGNVFADGTGLSATVILDDSAARDGEVGSDVLIATSAFTYDPAFSQLTSFVDELDRTTVRRIDPSNGNVLSATRVVGQLGGNDDLTSLFTYTASGLIDTETDPLGRVTKNTYDAFGRLIRIQRAFGTASETNLRFEYDLAGRLTASVDENGHRTQFTYDTMNRLRTTTLANGNVAITTYDSRGNAVSNTDPLGHVKRQSFDSLDRLVRQTDAGGNATLFNYDIAGNLTSVTDPLNHVVRTNYDARNRPVATIDANGGVTRYKYNANDELVSLQDARGNTTAFEYGTRGNITQITDPLGEVTSYLYDDALQLIEQKDRIGRVIQYAYNDLGDLTTEKWLNTDKTQANLIHYSYDAMGFLSQANDAFSSVAYTRDTLSRVLREQTAGPNGVPTSLMNFTYDAVGNVLTQQDVINGITGATNTSTYDVLNRVTQIIQTGAGIATKRVNIGYNALGQFTSLARFADAAGQLPVVASTFGYDVLSQLSSITHRNAANAVVNSHLFRYDVAGRITQVTDIDGVTSYAYDNRDELTAAKHEDAGNPDEAYVYDATGNRISSHLHGKGYVVGSGNSTGSDVNRLSSDGKFNYSYDANGNLTKRVEFTSGKVREYTYDHRNRLVKFTERLTENGPETQVVRYAYDLLNRRIASNVDLTPADAVDGKVTYYVYAGNDVIAETVDSDGSGPGSATISMRYLHGPAVDQVLAQETSNGSVQWMLADQLGTIRDLVNNTGQVVNHVKYDSYGNVISESSATVRSRYKFTGREFDTETELQYNRARYYDAAIGRFISEDPMGLSEGVNVYAYVSNIPVLNTDPEGMASIPSGLKHYPPDKNGNGGGWGIDYEWSGLGGKGSSGRGNSSEGIAPRTRANLDALGNLLKDSVKAIWDGFLGLADIIAKEKARAAENNARSLGYNPTESSSFPSGSAPGGQHKPKPKPKPKPRPTPAPTPVVCDFGDDPTLAEP